MTDQVRVPNDFVAVFEELKRILECYAPDLRVATDEPGNDDLNKAYIQNNKQFLFLTLLICKNNYVSFHLMPVYACPELLNTLSPTLRTRMQGKASFDFKTSAETDSSKQSCAPLPNGAAATQSRAWLLAA